MPTIIPLHDAGAFELVDIPRTWSSRGSLVTRRAADTVDPALGSLQTAGVSYAPALALLATFGEVFTPVLGSLDTGGTSQPINEASYGALATGYNSPDAALGSAELSGEQLNNAPGILEVTASPSVSGMIDYKALISLAIASEVIRPSRASHDDTGIHIASSRIALAANGEIELPSRATAETAIDAVYPASASVDTGDPVDSPPATAALDAYEGEGVDFIIDIQDSILSSGHGDC